MKTLTLFSAYQKAVSDKDMFVHFRDNDRVGIAVENDFWATQWQHRDRQERKFEAEIVKRMKYENT